MTPRRRPGSMQRRLEPCACVLVFAFRVNDGLYGWSFAGVCAPRRGVCTVPACRPGVPRRASPRPGSDIFPSRPRLLIERFSIETESSSEGTRQSAEGRGRGERGGKVILKRLSWQTALYETPFPRYARSVEDALSHPQPALASLVCASRGLWTVRSTGRL